LQTISTNNTPGNLTLSNTGGTVTLNINDADANPTNEIQSLTLTGNTLAISGSNSVILPTAVNTNLSVTGTASPLTLNSSTGTDVNILSGPGIGLSAGANTITINNTFQEQDGNPTNEIQTLSTNALPGNLTLSNGGGTVNLNVNDADANPTNEIQTLSIAGNSLSISGGNAITLPASSGTVTNVSGIAPISVANNTSTPQISINPLGITNTLIANDAITSEKILEGTIATSDIGDNQVTISKLPTGAATNKYLKGDGTWHQIFLDESPYHIPQFSSISNSLELSGMYYNLNGTLVLNGLPPSNDPNIAIFAGGRIGTTFPLGYDNIAIGTNSGNISQTGASNIYIGHNAGKNSTTSVGNHLIGYGSGQNLTSGNNNTLIGQFAGSSLTIGSSNVSVGDNSGSFGQSDSLNVLIGNLAQNPFGGKRNVTIGALSKNTNSLNIAIGYNTVVSFSGLNSSVIGSNSTCYSPNSVVLGSNIFISNSTFTNSIAIGNSTPITGANQARIGNTAITSIGGQVAWSTLSDGRFKTNVVPSKYGLEFIKKLRPVDYSVDKAKLKAFYGEKEQTAAKNESQPVQSGFIAQEVEAAAKELNLDFSGVDKPQNDKSTYALRYSEFVVPLVKAVQEQQDQIESQDKLIKELMVRLDRQDQLIKGLQDDKK
jgi:Chaperone of endosialidase